MAAISLEPKDEAALQRFVDDCRDLHGNRLHAVLLYGEAASPAYRGGRTPLTTAVVLDQVTPEALRALQGRAGAWRRRRIPTPLVVDEHYLATSHDVFPIEFLEMRDHHRLLFGARDPLADLAIDRTHLRLEVEEQIKGKLLHLREGYVESEGSAMRLRELLSASILGFEIVLRGMLHLTDAEVPADPEALLRAVERTFELALPTLHRLRHARSEGEKIPRAELDDLMTAYLEEVAALAGAADRL